MHAALATQVMEIMRQVTSAGIHNAVGALVAGHKTRCHNDVTSSAVAGW